MKVNYLDDAAFEKKFAITSKLTKKEQDQVDESAALFRAAGLAGPGFDIRKAASTAQSAGVLGYYEPKSKQIYVRGKGTLNAYATVTLAHELTHVLQDQYFDLEKRDAEMDKSKTASSDAFRAIVEGDAVSVQNAYLKAQNKAFNDEYQQESKKFGAQDTARSKDVPAAVSVELQAPYLFGPPVIDVLTADDPHDAVNEILKSGEPTTRIFFDPTQSAVRGTLPVAPKLRTGEVESKISTDHDFDSFTLFVMLASRVDAVTALDAVDTYETGSAIQYKRGDTTCFRASITTKTPEGARGTRGRGEQLGEGTPRGRIGVSTTGDVPLVRRGRQDQGATEPTDHQRRHARRCARSVRRPRTETRCE